MLVAEVVCTMRQETRQHVRAALYLASALGNNLPDSDILYSWMDGPKPLGSLLHHRGHTHTLAIALPMAWLLGFVIWRWFRRRHADAGVAEKRLIFGLSIAGPAFHLLLDFGNNYGVHPFWPATGRWFYGDSIFIVEPLWLAVLVPILARAIARRWLRIVLWVVLVAVLAAYWYLPFFSWTARLCLLSVAGLSLLVSRQANAPVRAAYGVVGAVCIALVFAVASWRAKSNLREAAQAAFPALAVHDISTAPLPGNPRCWEGLLAGEQSGVYRVLRATIALGGGPAACIAGNDTAPTAPVSRLDRADRGGVRWRTEYSAEISALSKLRREDCRFAALLHFARLPYVSKDGRHAGDLRYDRQPGLDFSDMELPAKPSEGSCPKLVPGWGEPRGELFPP
ncbi:MAG: Membrane-bound metal-dependent hydrolase [Polyangiaceae bacterium]|jgi:inner membrane protein|nr:Membrane-bound metal-dependent hydrolase [Polyangiaceae bacterium]